MYRQIGSAVNKGPKFNLILDFPQCAKLRVRSGSGVASKWKVGSNADPQHWIKYHR
jgi:hypothetical protein